MIEITPKIKELCKDFAMALVAEVPGDQYPIQMDDTTGVMNLIDNEIEKIFTQK